MTCWEGVKLDLLDVVVLEEAIDVASDAMLSRIQGLYHQVEQVTHHLPLRRDGVERRKLDTLNTLNMLHFVHFYFNLVSKEVSKQMQAVLGGHGYFLLGLLLYDCHEVLVVLLEAGLLVQL